MNFNLKKVATALFLCLVAAFTALGQGKIAGKVVDKATGETVIGANITVEGANTGGVTDLDGNYFITAPAGTYKLKIEYLGYLPTSLDVVVIDKETTYLNAVITEASEQLNEVVVQAESTKRETVNALLVQQKNAVANVSGITAEQFRKLPDRTTADIMKRISGASIQDNKFAVIRGLNDRYNMAMVNGLPMPSTESDRKAFSFDLIPASLLDNMVIVKTATPDLSGDFAGGIIQINTKDIPEENSQSLNVGFSAQSITTFKEGLRETTPSGNFLGNSNSGGGFPEALGDKQSYSQLKNSEFAKNSKLFDNNYSPKKISSARPNLNFQYTFARRFQIKNNPFGVILALNYNNNLRYTNGEINIFPNPGLNSFGTFYQQNNIYRTQTLAGGLLNFAYRVGQNTKFSWKNLYNINSDGFTANRQGGAVTDDIMTNTRNIDTAYYFSSNRMYSSQLSGEHVFANKIKIKTIIGLNLINRDVPNYKKISYVSRYDAVAEDGSFTKPFLDVPQSPGSFAASSGQYFSKLNERSYNWALDVNFPLTVLRTDLKVGTFNQRRIRDFEFIALCYTSFNNSFFGSATSDKIFTDKNFDSGSIGLKFSDYTSYKGTSTTNALYIMGDTRFTDLFRLIYGARVEFFNQNVTTSNVVEPAILNNKDVLPSATFIYSITPKMNLKLAASKTLSRPEFREVSPAQFYDFNSQSIVEGNPFLKRSQIYNLDVKYEFYPTAGETFSVSPFYKRFIDPIETIIDAAGNSRKYNYVNQSKAICYGVEFEARKKFLKNFVVFANYAIINSIVTSIDPQDENKNRPLQGQSPYVVNGGLQYNNDKYMFNSSLSINRVGNRIAYQSIIAKQMIWENARTIIDFQISKTFLKKVEIKYILGDLLAKPLIFFNDLDGNKLYDKDKDIALFSYRMGFTNSISLNYKF